jgi:hypothetical protein
MENVSKRTKLMGLLNKIHDFNLMIISLLCMGLAVFVACYGLNNATTLSLNGLIVDLSGAIVLLIFSVRYEMAYHFYQLEDKMVRKNAV